jgi:hypothetical protein
VEKLRVMVAVKRMISGGIAAVLAVALAMPLAFATTAAGRDVREKNPKGSSQNQQQTRKPRPYAQRQGSGDEQRPQRLSPEERRQLRRDIKDAGSEIYPPRR